MSSEPEKKESSVLFSLRELQQIEEERVSEEEEAARRAEEERIRNKMEAERRAREEEEARMRAEQDAERMAQEARDRQQREEALRLQEAETRARIEAQQALEAQRLHHEMEARKIEASKKRPTALIATAVALVVLVAGLGYWAYNKAQEKEHADQVAKMELEQKERERKALEEENKKLAAQMAEFDRKIDEAMELIKMAKTDAERAAAQRRLDDLRAQKAAAKKRGGSSSKKPKKPDNTVRLSPECIANPLSPACQ